MITFTEYQPRKVTIYNRFIRENRFTRRYLFPRHAGYRWMRYFFRDMVPYCTVREGDTVIQVSAAEPLLGRGLSQPIIYSALVGPKGRVIVVEPDPVNLSGMIRYIRLNNISNITLVPKAAWDEKGTRPFTFILGGSTANVQSDYVGRRSWPSDDPLRIVQERDTEVDTLDNIVSDHGVDTIGHVNLTVNGTEYHVLQGLTSSLSRVESISFVYQNINTVRSPILDHVESNGFDIVVKHAPVSMKQRQFLVAMATRKRTGILRTMFERGYDARFAYAPEQHVVQVEPA